MRRPRASRTVRKAPLPAAAPSCCYPLVCRHFETPQAPYVALLRAVAAAPGVGHVRVASGVRADMALREPEALAAYAEEFTGGQLKLAPEHCAPGVLAAMRKPPLEVFERFLGHFMRLSRFAGREQYVVPYLMSAFPGCTDDDMRQLGALARCAALGPAADAVFHSDAGHDGDGHVLQRMQ